MESDLRGNMPRHLDNIEKPSFEFREQMVPPRLIYLMQNANVTLTDLLFMFLINSLVRSQGRGKGLGSYASNSFYAKEIGVARSYISERIKVLRNLGLVLVIHSEGIRYLELEWSRVGEEKRRLEGQYGEDYRKEYEEVMKLLDKTTVLSTVSTILDRGLSSIVDTQYKRDVLEEEGDETGFHPDPPLEKSNDGGLVGISKATPKLRPNTSSDLVPIAKGFLGVLKKKRNQIGGSISKWTERIATLQRKVDREDFNNWSRYYLAHALDADFKGPIYDTASSFEKLDLFNWIVRLANKAFSPPGFRVSVPFSILGEWKTSPPSVQKNRVLEVGIEELYLEIEKEESVEGVFEIVKVPMEDEVELDSIPENDGIWYRTKIYHFDRSSPPIPGV